MTADPGQPVTALDVLIVEDEPVVRSVMDQVLTRAGYSTTQADNGVAALEAVGQRDYRAIVCDIHMPRLNGIEFYQALRTRKPALADRCVFVTAVASSPPVSEFFAQADCVVIEKPYELKTLINAVSKLVGRPPSREMLL